MNTYETNIIKLFLEYKSEKNFIVKDFYKTLGFNKVKSNKTEGKWEYKITNKYVKKNKIIKITNEK